MVAQQANGKVQDSISLVNLAILMVVEPVLERQGSILHRGAISAVDQARALDDRPWEPHWNIFDHLEQGKGLWNPVASLAYKVEAEVQILPTLHMPTT
jgi:hypothetical protein